jgi:hypothetical protein
MCPFHGTFLICPAMHYCHCNFLLLAYLSSTSQCLAGSDDTVDQPVNRHTLAAIQRDHCPTETRNTCTWYLPVNSSVRHSTPPLCHYQNFVDTALGHGTSPDTYCTLALVSTRAGSRPRQRFTALSRIPAPWSNLHCSARGPHKVTVDSPVFVATRIPLRTA